MYNPSYYKPIQISKTRKAAKPKQRRLPGKLFAVSFLILAGSFLWLTYFSSQSSSAVPEIKSGVAGYCIDLYHDQTTPDSPIETEHCKGTTAQSWTYSNDSINHNRSYCLTISGDGTTAGNKIVSDPCNGSASQIWVGAIGGYENPASVLCLSLPSNQVGSQLIAASCTHLTQTSELWSPSTWSASNNSPATISCSSGTTGQRVACNAAEQWIIWNASSSNHTNLLNTYSDGNSYEEWCADFISWIYKQAGDPFTGGERGNNNWDEYLATAIQNENFTYHDASNYTPKTGDVAFFDYNGGHVEIVAIGGAKPLFIYGDSHVTDPATGNGDMAENTITNDGNAGQVIYYLSPN